jgi:predicted RNase H-like nuclease
MQIQPPTQQFQVSVVAMSASMDRDEVIQCQGDKIACLQAQLAQLSAIQAPVPHPNQPGADPVQTVTNNAPANVEAPVQQATPQQTLFMDKAEAEQVQAQLLAKATEDSSSKRATLPDIVPGFKVIRVIMSYKGYNSALHLESSRMSEGGICNRREYK